MQRLLVAVFSLAIAAMPVSAKRAAPPIKTHYLLLDSGGHITLNQGGSLLCNRC